MNNSLSVLATAIALGLPLLVPAQTGDSDPAQAQQSVPALHYDSAFTDYKPWQDSGPVDWRGVNDALLKEGSNGSGHAGHGAAASAPAPAAAHPAMAPDAGSHAGHSGHRDKK